MLEFGGLTFPATVFVDGVEVAECVSMFVPVRVRLEPGAHEVAVRFGSLSAWLTTGRPRGRWRSNLAGPPGLRWARTTLLGRAPVYGDVPVPVGFWRPVTVAGGRTPLTAAVTADPDSGAVGVTGSGPDGELRYAIEGPSGDLVATGRVQVTAGRFTIDSAVPDPRLWWPHGYGAQPLYRLQLETSHGSTTRTFGFRSIQATDAGGGFGLRVNGVDVFCRGATWFPPDPVALTVDDATMRRHVAAFADAGANMLRIVGGLVPEQPEFWQHCAELGVLVWQDAMLATFDPPAELSEVIVEEVTGILIAASGNPALAVVSGGSETLQRPEMLGLDRAGHAMELLDTLLPQAVARAADVPFVRSSPAPPVDSEDLAIRPDTGVAHWFGVGGYLRPLTDVRTAGVRFAAECLAFANPPSAAAVERHFGSAAVAGHDPRWKAGVPRDRGASWDFEDVRDFYVREVFGTDPAAVRRLDPERYLELGRLAIAEAMLECYRYWRRADSRCHGALVLAGKDARPGAGWGLLDVDGEPKAALHVLRRVWAPQAVSLSDEGLSGIRVDIHNDTAITLTAELTLTALDAVGRITARAGRDIQVRGHASATFFDTELTGVFRNLSGAFRFGAATADGVEATLRRKDDNTVIRDVLVVNPRQGQIHPGLRASASPEPGGDWTLRVATDVALRWVSIDIPGWLASDNYFHLLGDSAATVRLRSDGEQPEPRGKLTSIDCLNPVPIDLNI